MQETPNQLETQIRTVQDETNSIKANTFPTYARIVNTRKFAGNRIVEDEEDNVELKRFRNLKDKELALARQRGLSQAGLLRALQDQDRDHCI